MTFNRIYSWRQRRNHNEQTH